MGVRPTTASTTASTPVPTKKYGNVSSRLGAASTKKAADDADTSKPMNSSRGGMNSSRGGIKSSIGVKKEVPKVTSSIGGGLKKPTATGAAAPKTPVPSSLKAPNNTRAGTSMGTSGLSRPSTSKPTMSKTDSGTGGLKAPSSIKKEDSKNGSTSTASTPIKKTPSTLPKSSLATGPKSAASDEVDEIYKKDDPIGITVDSRKKAGSLTSTVVAKAKPQYFFTLKQTGDKNYTLYEIPKKEEVKVDDDLIEDSFNLRRKAVPANSTAPFHSQVVKGKDSGDKVITLKLKGKIPELAVKPDDPRMKAPEGVAAAQK